MLFETTIPILCSLLVLPSSVLRAHLLRSRLNLKVATGRSRLAPYPRCIWRTFVSFPYSSNTGESAHEVDKQVETEKIGIVNGVASDLDGEFG